MNLAIKHEFQLLDPFAITVLRDERQRRVVDVKGLKESIAKWGVMQPIIVQRPGEAGAKPTLVVGERRLTCCKELGIPVPVRFTDDLSPVELQLVELEENIRRQDLPWQDIVKSVARIHELHKESEATWSQTETAESIGLSMGTVSIYLTVAGSLDEERIANADTVREAYNFLRRADQRKQGDALAELLSDPLPLPERPSEAKIEVLSVVPYLDQTIVQQPVYTPGSAMSVPQTQSVHVQIRSPNDSILHESFLQWAPRYSGPKFNLIHCDFPYGIKVFAGKQSSVDRDAEGYDDSPELYFQLLNCLLVNWDRFAAISSHMVFWYSAKHRVKTMALMEELRPDLAVNAHDLIWLKSDNSGIVEDSQRLPRHVYETAMFISTGRRNIVKIVADAYSSPTDKKWHPSTKPQPMMEHFLSMLVDRSTRLLDPTCGSGSALRAAEKLGAETVLGLENDEQSCGLARTALRQFRTLRGL